MESLLYKAMPLPMLKTEANDDCDLDVDCAIVSSPHQEVITWDTSVRKKITKYAVCQNEKMLDEMMKSYIRSLHAETVSFNDKLFFREKLAIHMKFFHSYYLEIQNNFIEATNYLQLMEDIALVYCHLELDIIKSIKRSDCTKRDYKKLIKLVTLRICNVLKTYLINNEKHILHVLLKIKHERLTQGCKDVLDLVYTHVAISSPNTDMSDEALCRFYLLFQKWKEIRKKEEHKEMDQAMYLKFKLTPESIEKNKVIREVTSARSQSVVDVVVHLIEGRGNAVKNYFKYLEDKAINEEDLHLLNLIELDSDEEQTDINRGVANIIQDTTLSSSTSRSRPNNNRSIWDSLDDEDGDIRYVPDRANSEKHLVCVINDSDSDSDIMEMLYLESNNESTNTTEKLESVPRPIIVHSPRSTPAIVSFLDSITVTMPTISIPPTCHVAESHKTVETAQQLPSSTTEMDTSGSIIEQPDTSSSLVELFRETLNEENAALKASKKNAKTDSDTRKCDFARSRNTTIDSNRSNELKINKMPLAVNRSIVNATSHTKSPNFHCMKCHCSENNVQNNFSSDLNLNRKCVSRTVEVQTGNADTSRNATYFYGQVTPPSCIDETSTQPERLNVCVDTNGSTAHNHRVIDSYTYGDVHERSAPTEAHKQQLNTDTRNSNLNNEVCNVSQGVQTEYNSENELDTGQHDLHVSNVFIEENWNESDNIIQSDLDNTVCVGEIVTSNETVSDETPITIFPESSPRNQKSVPKPQLPSHNKYSLGYQDSSETNECLREETSEDYIETNESSFQYETVETVQNDLTQEQQVMYLNEETEIVDENLNEEQTDVNMNNNETVDNGMLNEVEVQQIYIDDDSLFLKSGQNVIIQNSDGENMEAVIIDFDHNMDENEPRNDEYVQCKISRVQENFHEPSSPTQSSCDINKQHDLAEIDYNQKGRSETENDLVLPPQAETSPSCKIQASISPCDQNIRRGRRNKRRNTIYELSSNKSSVDGFFTSTPTKQNRIIFTSTETIQATPLAKFSEYNLNVNDSLEGDEVSEDVVANALSGPVTRLNGSNSMFNANTDDFDFFNTVDNDVTSKKSKPSVVDAGRNETRDSPSNSRSNSPLETSPAYEEIDDFQHYIQQSGDKLMVRTPKNINNTVGDNSDQPNLLSIPVQLDRRRIPGILNKNYKSSTVNMVASSVAEETVLPSTSNLGVYSNSNKRKHHDDTEPNKRRVKFHPCVSSYEYLADGSIDNPTNGRVIIKNRRLQLTLNHALESMRYYGVKQDDPKLVKLCPEIRLPKMSEQELIRAGRSLIEEETIKLNKRKYYHKMLSQQRLNNQKTCILEKVVYDKSSNSTVAKVYTKSPSNGDFQISSTSALHGSSASSYSRPNGSTVVTKGRKKQEVPDISQPSISHINQAEKRTRKPSAKKAADKLVVPSKRGRPKKSHEKNLSSVSNSGAYHNGPFKPARKRGRPKKGHEQNLSSVSNSGAYHNGPFRPDYNLLKKS